MIIIFLYMFLLRLKHYKMYAIYLFTIPVIIFLRWFLTGEFVKTISLFNLEISYLYFLVISALFSDMLWHNIRTFLNSFYQRDFLYMILLKGMKRVYMGKMVEEILDSFLFYFLIFLLIYLFVSKDVFILVFSAFLSIILILPAMSLALIFSPLLLYFRGMEAEIVVHNLRNLTVFLVPTGFTYLAFQFYDKIRFVPVVGFIEELRRFVFIGEISFEILLINLIEIFLLLIVGIIFFIKAFEYARLKGWIGLE